MRLLMAWGAQHRRSGPPRGLKNLGNTCYLNSVLQCLAHTPPFAQFCLASQHSSLCKDFVSRDKECGFCILERQIVRLHTPAQGIFAAVDTPSKLLKSLSIFAEHFKWGRQEDAHEFLRYVIDTCHTACARLSKARSSTGYNSNGGAHDNSETVMRKIFGGALLSQVKCMACKGESNKTDEIMDLSLDVCHSTSVKDALARFFQPEILDGSNKYSCERCKKLSVAKKQMFVSQAPNVLVIQLKRFEGIGGKINRNIEFEEVLLLSSFMFNRNQGSQTEYSLFGSIVHAGFSQDSGHYYAYIKDASGNWYCCNDTQVSRSSAQEVLSEKVYVLFYILRNTNPKQNKTANNGYHPQAKPLHPNVSEAPKLLAAKQNGTCTAKINGSGAPNSHPVNQIGPVKFEIKKSTLNGTTKSEARNKNNTVIKKGNSPPNLSSSGESKSVNKVKSSFSNGNNGSSKGSVLREVQNIVKKNPGPSFNGDAGCIQSSVSVPEREDSCSRNGGGEVSVSLTKESKSLAERKSSDKNVSSCILQSRQELQKLKDLLVCEASSELRSCGWTDEVQSYMRDRKRLCVRQDASNTLGASLLREQLINESKRTFNSQIPESLKGKLYQRLISFSKDYSLLDS